MPLRRPPGALLVALLGAVAGALLGIFGYALVQMATLGLPFSETLPAAALGAGGGPAFPVVLGAAIVGFLVVGAAVRNRLATRILGALGRTVTIAVGLGLGAAFGFVAYLAFTMMQGTGASLADTFAAAAGGAGGPFLLAGALAGLVGAAYVLGRGAFRNGARIVAGLMIGGIAGVLVYSVAYVLVHYPGLPADASYFMHIADAINSLSTEEFLTVGIGAVTGTLLSGYSWRLYGTVTFVSLLFVILGYLLYSLTWTIPSVPVEDRALSWALFACECASLLMVLLYSFYTIDVAARKRWRRSTTAAPFSPYYLPKVAIHVPTFNEPFDLVRDTLRSLLALDYPADRLVLMVADDSTEASSSEPLKHFCSQNRIAYLHRTDRRGYKAGALNALLGWTPEDCNLIAVVDADYQVEPQFLRETVGYFVDANLGWLQTPQDYRNRDESFLTRQYYLADSYFYRTVLPSRNEENSIIFCGTMGMLRRRALEDVGGWGEQYITEDAELSVRLLNAGWRSLYVNRTYGRGLIPPTFNAYKKQQYRWAFGGGKILRGHFGRFLFGRFTFRQRLDYLIGNMTWFEGAFIFLIGLFVLALGWADILQAPVLTHHSHEILLVGLVPLFLLMDGLIRVHLVLRRTIKPGFGGTLRILGMWSSVKFSNMRAALKAFIGFNMPFVRTPKAPQEAMGRARALRYAVGLTRFETTMAVALAAACIGVAARTVIVAAEAPQALPTQFFLAFWLLYYTLVFSAAPLYAYKSLASAVRPPAAASQPEPKPQEAQA